MHLSRRLLLLLLTPLLLLTYSAANAQLSAAPHGPLLLALVPEHDPATLPDSPLPDAPEPQTAPASEAPHKHSHSYLPSRNNPPVAPRWAKVIHPGQEPSRFNFGDKMVFVGHQQVQPEVLVAALISGGWDHLVDGNPRFGSDREGFAERFGAAMLRQGSGRFFADGVFAGLLRQDPRYYRIGGRAIVHRALFSARQAIARRSDSGENEFNWSASLGHLSSAALTLTYYPHVSANGATVSKNFATSYAGDAAGDLFMEFLPDIFDLALHRHRAAP